MKTVYVLGAGVERVLGLPLADELLSELAEFSKGAGKDISRAIKDKLGGARRVSFNFDKYVANQGETFAERVLTDEELAQTLRDVLARIDQDGSEGGKAVQTLVNKLLEIREANEFDQGTAEAVANLAGESRSMADNTMLRLRGIALNPAPRNAMLKVFRDLESAPGLSEQEKNTFQTFVSAMTDIEGLLTELFAGFYTHKGTEIRRYLYVSWLLWAYMLLKAHVAKENITDVNNFYQLIKPLSGDELVITFNYTGLGDFPSDRIVAFHGDCFSYIRRDRGEMNSTDERVTQANDIHGIVAFINELDMNVDENRLFLPAIVPPSAMKPLLNSAFIERWYSAGQMLKNSEMMIIVGYSFNRVDSHFNELFVAAGGGKKIVVINPDLEGTKSMVCNLLGVNPDTLSRQTIEGVPVESSANLLFVPVRCEELSAEMLARIRAGL